MTTKIGMISRMAIAAALIAISPMARAADAAPAAPADPAAAGSPGDEIIVTGTRAIGITAAESAAPAAFCWACDVAGMAISPLLREKRRASAAVPASVAQPLGTGKSVNRPSIFVDDLPASGTPV